jgi:type II restriction-modification system restriction subunit
MSNIKISQYTHRPNVTELGLGNTHETYLSISKEVDLSNIFRKEEIVNVYDFSTKKIYTIKPTIANKEFRITQMADIYRDEQVLPGDEITFIAIGEREKRKVLLFVKKFNRVFIDVSAKGAEIVNIERLEAFKTTNNVFSIPNVKQGSNVQTLTINFLKKDSKRTDSPSETDFYQVNIGETSLPKGKYLLNLGENNNYELFTFSKYQFSEIEVGEDLFRNTTEKQSSENTTPIKTKQVIFFGTPGSGKSHCVDKKILKDVSEDNIFRTTFHPDTDYASFVGCYKPIAIHPPKRALLSLEELKKCFTNYLKNNENYPIHRFCVKYSTDIERLSKEERLELLSAGNKGDSYDTELLKVLACRNEFQQEYQSPEISYSFVPQVFTNAYVKAWQNPSENIYLVIEEINRGNCAQIFGDLFQLLDRNSEGKSSYHIKADKDLRTYIETQLSESNEGIKNGNLCFPANLHILATMNTSDQSLFPMDSAFKRRWDWEYIPINYSEQTSGNFVITLNEKQYRWIDFLKAINLRIRETTDSEDKQMGNFFIKKSVEETEFKSKVMFYLWNEVCKDEYHTKNNFFRTSQDEEFSFNELYEEKSTECLHKFMEYLGVTPIEKQNVNSENVEKEENIQE